MEKDIKKTSPTEITEKLGKIIAGDSKERTKENTVCKSC